jgi:hypothetical protein
METSDCQRRLPRCRPWMALISLLAAVAFLGCQSQESRLRPGAAEFKKEVQSCIATLRTALIEPLSKKNIPAINETLKKIEPEAIKLCRMCPFRIGVLNHEGYTLTVYPPKEDAIGNFSNYAVVIQALQSHRTASQRFFLQDGSQIYIICIPILKDDQVLGILALAVSAEEAKQRWDMTAQEFLAIDFNR